MVIAACIIYLALVAISLSLFEPVLHSGIPMFLGVPILLGWLWFWMVGVPWWILHEWGYMWTM